MPYTYKQDKQLKKNENNTSERRWQSQYDAYVED